MSRVEMGTTAGGAGLVRRSGRPPSPGPVRDGSAAALTSPRFLLYSHDALGLGHVRRNLVIADALASRPPVHRSSLPPAPSTLTASGYPERVDLMRLPAIRKVGNGRYLPRRLPIPGSDLTALREGILAAAVESYEPDVLLVDRHPLGVGDELRTALHRLRKLGGRAVLGLRDVLDDPASVREEWTAARKAIVLEHYGRVLVYGSPSVFDTLGGPGCRRSLLRGRATAGT